MQGHCTTCGSTDIIIPLHDILPVECGNCHVVLGTLSEWKAYLADQTFSPEMRAREALKLTRKQKRWWQL